MRNYRCRSENIIFEITMKPPKAGLRNSKQTETGGVKLCVLQDT